MTARSQHRHSLTWRVNRAIEHAGEQRPLLARTGPAWVFGLMGVATEAYLAPVVLAITVAVTVASYLLLDTPGTRIRAQQRPRFVSVRLLYLNTLIVAGFWLAVMFVFSAADPAVSSGVQQRLPVLLEVATTTDLRTLVTANHAANAHAVVQSAELASTWFDVFVHGLICTLAVDFLLFALVIARRRRRSHHVRRGKSRRPLRYDPMLGMFVDEDAASPR